MYSDKEHTIIQYDDSRSCCGYCVTAASDLNCELMGTAR